MSGEKDIKIENGEEFKLTLARPSLRTSITFRSEHQTTEVSIDTEDIHKVAKVIAKLLGKHRIKYEVKTTDHE